jgi:hypothetical protein
MKRFCIRGCFSVAFILSIHTFSSAQVNYFTIGSVNKISSTQGNFLGLLDNGDCFGNHVDTVGDLNNDGITDLVVGAPWDDDGGVDKGAVYILFMNSNGTVNHHQKISDTQGNFTGTLYQEELLGSAVACIGDVNGDSINDIAVGGIFDNDGGTWKGSVWIIRLDTNGTAKGYTKISTLSGNFTGSLSNMAVFGIDIASIGDFNNDGTTDLLVGASRQDDGNLRAGSAWILLMDTGGYVLSHKKISMISGNLNLTLDVDDRFGHGLTPIGDVNGDGVTDIAVNATFDDDGGTDRGAIYILMLDTSGSVIHRSKISSLTTTFNSVLDNSDWFGHRLDAIPDIDGDGIPELVASAIGDDDGGSNRGAFYVLYIDSTGALKYYQKFSATQGSFTGSIGLGSQFGYVGGIGDFNRDGFIDLAVGANMDNDGGTSRGAVWIIKGPQVAIPLIANGIEDSEICLGDSALVMVNVSGGTPPYQYMWSPALSNQSLHWVSPSQSTVYTVTVTDAFNSTLLASISVIVHPNPFVSLGPDTSMSIIDSLVLTATPGFQQYFWSDSSTQVSAVLKGWELGIGTYTFYVTVWDTNGCQHSDTIVVLVHDGNGIAESGHAFKVYPNPSEAYFIIEETSPASADEPLSISVLNSLGQAVVFRTDVSLPLSLDLSQFPPGVYFLQIDSAAKGFYSLRLIRH